MMTTLPTPGRRARLLPPLAPVSLTDDQRRVAHMAAALLLAYPDDATRAAAPTVRSAVAGLPAEVRDRLDPLAAALEGADSAHGEALRALQAEYVATFDLKRKCALYLTYYRAGDTRRRGHALVRFVEAYRAAGFEVASDELPDYLPTALELSAQARGESAKVAAALLAAHREGIEVLRSALAQLHSPWTAVVEAVCLTLGPVDERTADRVAELVLAGPPAELVGLSGYGAPDVEGGLPWT
jgi:nitrate reductase delta subunit